MACTGGIPSSSKPQALFSCVLLQQKDGAQKPFFHPISPQGQAMESEVLALEVQLPVSTDETFLFQIFGVSLSPSTQTSSCCISAFYCGVQPPMSLIYYCPEHCASSLTFPRWRPSSQSSRGSLAYTETSLVPDGGPSQQFKLIC